MLAIKYGYSVQQARPHGPGYPGFYLLWKGIEYVTCLSPHSVILEANFLFLLSAVALTYFAAKRLFDERTAVFATALLATNPVLLYFACTTELYVYDAAFSAFLVLLLIAPPRRFEIALYFVYGLLGAFRLSSVILTFPVILISLLMHFYRDRSFLHLFQCSVAIVIGLLVWLIPFLYNIGGWGQFVAMLQGVGDLPTSLVQNLGRLLPAMLWMTSGLFIIAVINSRPAWKKFLQFDSRYLILLLIEAVPLLFFTLKYYEKGYALILLAPVALLGSRLIGRGKRPNVTILAACCVNLLVFFAVPFIPPSAKSSLNHLHRSNGERFASSILRETSFFAPTSSHLRASDNASETSETIIGTLPKGSVIVVDISAGLWAFPRTLQAQFPEMVFLMPSETDTQHVRKFARDSLNYRYTWNDFSNSIQGKPAFYYLTDPQLQRVIGSPPGNSITSGGHTALFYIPRDSFEVLKKYDRTFFYRGGE